MYCEKLLQPSTAANHADPQTCAGFSLPDFEISNIKAVCKFKFDAGRGWTANVSAAQTNASDGPFHIVYVPEKKQVGISYR